MPEPKLIGRLMRPKELSDLTGISQATLSIWRQRTRRGDKPIGPPFMNLGERTIFYDRGVVARYIAERTVGLTEEEKAALKEKKKEALAIGLQVMTERAKGGAVAPIIPTGEDEE